ncbi:MAG TPA: response regulator, partial [Blastocatellia bacterium]|nr:response regulator [Blastocatellia bacterium]
QAQIVVSDTGRGISAEFLPYVFDRFRQADHSFSRQQGGLGLGLAIVRHLVELHGGTVSVDSAGLGLGATFKLSFPLVGLSGSRNLLPDGLVSYHQIEVGSELPPAQPDLLAGVKVLVVDDEPDTLKLCQVLLERAGAELRTANSAAAALDLLRDWRPDVLVADIGMPDQDGYDLIRQIRAREWSGDRRLPAIALTAYTKSDDRLRALTAGYQMHVPKPIEPEELTTVIASVCGRIGGGKESGS